MPQTTKFESSKQAGHQTFRVTAHMKTPAIIRGDLPLESLLAYCVHEETGKIRDEALAQVPLERLQTPAGEIWMCSSAHFDSFARTDEHIVGRGRHFTEIGPDFYDPNPRARIDGYAIAQENGPFKRLMNPYPVTTTSVLVWYACGDMLACQDLLSSLKWVGKRRGSGFGEIAQLVVEPWDGNPLVDGNGMVRRPVAVAKLPHLAGALPASRQKVIAAAEGHPAWLGEEELCAVPPSRVALRAAPVEVDGEMFFE